MRIGQGPIKGIVMLLGIAGVMVVALMALEGKFTPKIPAVDKIVFVSDRAGTPAIWMMNTDGSEPELLSVEGAIDSSPSWSSDGSRVTFTSERDGLAQVCTLQPMREKGEPRQLTVGTGVKLLPLMNPDGGTVSYLQQGRVYTVRLDGSNVEPILPPVDGAGATGAMNFNVKSPYVSMDWSFDGKSLAAVRQMDDLQTARIMMTIRDEAKDVTDLQDRPLTANRVSVKWAPGSRVVAVSLAAGNEGALVTRDYETDGFSLIVTGIAPGQCAWSPSGDKMAFEILEYQEGKSYSNAGLAVADLEAETYEIIARGDITGPSWTADGSRIVFTKAEEDGNRDIWIIDADGGGARNLTLGAGDNYDAVASPAGAR